jgi:hypothetical protein
VSVGLHSAWKRGRLSKAQQLLLAGRGRVDHDRYRAVARRLRAGKWLSVIAWCWAAGSACPRCSIRSTG